MPHNKREHLHKIAAHLGFPESEILMGLWDTMVSEREAEWIANLPATPHELAERLGQDEAEVARGLANLYDRGLALIREQTTEGPCYIADDNPGRLMDLVLFDKRYIEMYGEEFLDRWRAFYNEELVHIYEHPDPDTRPFRVIPIAEKVNDPRSVLPYEQVASLVRRAERISVQICPCRVRERACDNPLETCLAFDRIAEYHIQRGIGRELTVDEALELLKRCEDLGLVHTTENADQPTVICNCCPCCCVFLRAITAHGKRAVIDKSRFQAVVNVDACLACGTCEERCHFGAIKRHEGPAQVRADLCMGCGLCASACPAGAITLVEVRDESFIPSQKGGFLGEASCLP